jgi:hypothetical protein
MTSPVHDQDVTRLYHEGSADEPPAALDRAILQASRESIAPIRKAKKPWWLRFALPLQLALSVVLVTMLALTVDRNPPDVPALKERTGQQAPLPAPLNAVPGGSERAAGEAPAASHAPEARARLPAPGESRPSSPKVDRKDAEIPAAMAVPGRGERTSAEKAEAGDVAAPVGVRSLEAARQVPAAAGAAPGVATSTSVPAAKRAAAASSPSDWLAAIERLAAAGDKAAARVELEAFRKAYPDYPLPEGLEKLLAP